MTTRPREREPDSCPRCGGPVACGAAGPGPCACTGIRLDAATLAELRRHYSGCLCLGCLAELAAAPPEPARSPAR